MGKDTLTVRELRARLDGVPDDALVGWVEIDPNYTTNESLVVGGKWSDYEPELNAFVLTYGASFPIDEETGGFK